MQASAQVFDLPGLGPPVSDGRGLSPDDLPLTDEGPAEREVEAEPRIEAAPPPPPTPVAIPRFHDPRMRRVRPDLTARTRVRFLTSPNFGAFSALDEAGRPVGYNVELVRALCDALEMLPKCQIQVLPWNQLRGALARGDGEAIIAGLAITEETRSELSFTETYMRFPARFVRPRSHGSSARPADGATVAVVGGTAHEAMLRAFFPRLNPVSVPNVDALLASVRSGEASSGFGDGATLAARLASDEGRCCAFAGEPYLSEHYFGRGLAIAARADDTELTDALDWALGQLDQNGRLEEIYLRTFPVSFY